MTTKDIYGQKKVREIETTSRNFPFDGIILSKGIATVAGHLALTLCVL